MTLNPDRGYQRQLIPQSLIYPSNEKDLPWYFLNLYQQLADQINQRDYIYFKMAIGGSATIIPFMNNVGSYILCISGSSAYVDTAGNNYWPSHSYTINKNQPKVNGNTASLGSLVGTGTLAGVDFTISYIVDPNESGSNLYTAIKHNGVDLSGDPITASFNVKIIGNQ